MSRSGPTPIPRRRRTDTPVLIESGFVLVLVLPVALLLIMAALTLVARSNSAALTATRESRALAARMVAEYGFNELLGNINGDYQTKPDDSVQYKLNGVVPLSYYTISGYPSNPSYISQFSCNNNSVTPIDLAITGNIKIGSTIYSQTINRRINVCAFNSDPAKLRVRSFN